MDVQYSDDKYDLSTAGYGHGSPKYAGLLMGKTHVNKLFITHHDPAATDEEIKNLSLRVGECCSENNSSAEVRTAKENEVW